MILPVALYKCKTHSVILREEHGLGVLINMVPRKSGSKREEVTGRKKNFIDGISPFVLLDKYEYHLVDQIQKNETRGNVGWG